MYSKTLPYTINPKYLPRYWKTEHTENYISKEQHKLLHKPQNTTQQLIPFFIYKNR